MTTAPAVLIASDHAGFDLKAYLKRELPQYAWEDLGPPNTSPVDYPDFAAEVARRISNGQAQQGILICGTGIGMSMAANKFRGVRAAVVENPVAARLSREHNHANVLCLGARLLAPAYAVEIARVWLETEHSQNARHVERVRKIGLLEKPSRP